jgi:hypothetical protein
LCGGVPLGVTYSSPAISRLTALLTVRRAGLVLSSNLEFNVSAAGGTFNFRRLTMGLSAEAGVVNIAALVVINQSGSAAQREAVLLGGNLDFTVRF